MDWIALSLLSAVFLGVYELLKKHAVNANAVVPTLFWSTALMAGVWLVLILLDTVSPAMLPASFKVAPLTPVQHFHLLMKSLAVALSWVCSYFALKQLPLSLASPIRATGPVWTFAGALAIMGERPEWIQIGGVAVTLASFVGLSMVGRTEGVRFYRDKWVGLMMAGTLFSTVSALYDKFLLGSSGFSTATVQAWFSIYLVLLFSPLMIGWQRRWWPRGEFHWRWSIPMIGVGLLIADYLYFEALRDEEALISLVSSLRRGSTLVAFGGSLLFFGEINGWRKLPAVLGILAGICLIMAG